MKKLFQKKLSGQGWKSFKISLEIFGHMIVSGIHVVNQISPLHKPVTLLPLENLLKTLWKKEKIK